MPDCPFLSVSPPLSLVDFCFFCSLNRGLSPLSRLPKAQARSSLHLCITDSFHQCWVSISSWCHISAQPTKPTPCLGSCITSWKSLLCSRLCKGCLQRSSTFIHSVLYVLFLLQVFFPLTWQETVVCVGRSLFHELNPCFAGNRSFSCSNGNEIPWRQQNFSKEHFYCQALFLYLKEVFGLPLRRFICLKTWTTF